MVRGCDTRDRRAYSRVGGDLERATAGRRGEGRRSLRRRRNGDEHPHGSEDPLGSTSWKHGRGSATRVGQLSSRGTGKGESSFSLSLSLTSHPPPLRAFYTRLESRSAEFRGNLPFPRDVPSTSLSILFEGTFLDSGFPCYVGRIILVSRLSFVRLYFASYRPNAIYSSELTFSSFSTSTIYALQRFLSYYSLRIILHDASLSFVFTEEDLYIYIYL